MKASKTTVLTVAEKCKNILASNWQGSLNTIKADANGSKQGIHTSKVKFFVKKGKPYIWVPENDLHNVNTIIDERCSFAVSSPTPGSLGSLLRYLKMPPARIAIVGDLVALQDKKLKLAAESLKESILSEQKVIKDFTYSVSGVISSSNTSSTLRSESLQDLLDDNKQFVVYKFNSRFVALRTPFLNLHRGMMSQSSSISYIDNNGQTHEVELQNAEACKADSLSLFCASLIDGINQSEVRRRALMLFCATFFENNVKDAYVVSVDHKGFDVLGKVLGPIMNDGSWEYQWKDYRFTFKEEARDVEAFCSQLVKMEEEAVNKVKISSGL